ncbi:YigZ family protein, partial [Colwellia marinimaniae]
LTPTKGRQAADQFVRDIKAQHPSARHHCWAFVAGRPSDGQQYGFSDDGEPSGTAGKPILNCLLGCNVGEMTAVVVRYYGGIKLGTGGLVRA